MVTPKPITRLIFDLSGDMTPSGKPQPEPTIYTDYGKISLVDSDDYRSAPTYGIKVVLTGDFVFVFNPRERFLNITDLWIFMICSTGDPDPRGTTMNVTLNGVQISSDNFGNLHEHPTAHRVHVQDSDLYGAFEVGINALTLDVLVFMYVYEITVFIEYEYQAR